MKTSLAFGMAVEGLCNGLSVTTCDLDTEHRSLSEHHRQRKQQKIEPLFSVFKARNARDAVTGGAGCDLYIIDCPSRATSATLEVAKGVDLVVQPTTTSRKDLDLAIKTFYQLIQTGMSIEKLLFVVTRVSTAARLREAQSYLRCAEIAEKRFNVLSAAVWERPGYEMALNDGYSIVETSFSSLNTASRAVIHQILTQCLRHE